MTAYPTIAEYRSRHPHPARTGGGTGHPLAVSADASPAPLVSIITAVRNGRATLEQAIASVVGQSYRRIEYIIIDGASTDGTVDLLRSQEAAIGIWLSEPDNGISDAFNKGISLASGEFIGLLNADDWMSPDQVEQGVAALQAAEADFVFGDVLFHDASGRPPYRIQGDPYYRRVIRTRMPELCHPTVLARRSAYERIGLFDTRLRYAMDYEWLLRLHSSGAAGRYVPGITGHMRGGGASDRYYARALQEVRAISIRYGHSALSAHALFGYRLLKGACRRSLERMLPQGLFGRMRRAFNPRYQGPDAQGRERSSPKAGSRQ